MEVLSSNLGFSLIFNSIDDLKTNIKNLQNQLIWVEEEKIEPPYLYLNTNNYQYTIEELEKYISELKRRLK